MSKIEQQSTTADAGFRVVLPSFNVIGQFGADRGVIFKAGDIVDTADPFTASIIKGQEYKFGPVPSNVSRPIGEPAQMRDGRARGTREAWERANGKRTAVPTKVDAAISKAAAKVEGIQAPDVSPKKATAK